MRPTHLALIFSTATLGLYAGCKHGDDNRYRGASAEQAQTKRDGSNATASTNSRSSGVTSDQQTAEAGTTREQPSTEGTASVSNPSIRNPSTTSAKGNEGAALGESQAAAQSSDATMAGRQSEGMGSRPGTSTPPISDHSASSSSTDRSGSPSGTSPSISGSSGSISGTAPSASGSGGSISGTSPSISGSTGSMGGSTGSMGGSTGSMGGSTGSMGGSTGGTSGSMAGASGSLGGSSTSGDRSGTMRRSGDNLTGDATVHFTATPGSNLTGMAAFTDQPGGTKIIVDVHGAKPGRYDIEINQSSACSAVLRSAANRPGLPSDKSSNVSPSARSTESKDTRGHENHEVQSNGAPFPGGSDSSALQSQEKTMIGQLTIDRDGHGRLEATLSPRQLKYKKVSALDKQTLLVRDQGLRAGTQAASGSSKTTNDNDGIQACGEIRRADRGPAS